MTKTMTISSFYPPTRYPSLNQKPFIRIANKYLGECGFHIGDKIEVQYQPNQIIIKPAPKEESLGAERTTYENLQHG